MTLDEAQGFESVHVWGFGPPLRPDLKLEMQRLFSDGTPLEGQTSMQPAMGGC